MYMRVCICVCLVASVLGQYDIQPPDMSLIQPQGLRMAIPHEEGITLFAVHYSVNKPLLGVEAGDWNFDINAPTGNQWVHENVAVVVNLGDTVNYWIYVLFEGVGYQLLEQSWIAVSGTTSTVSTTTPPPTTSPTTTPTTTTASTTTGPTTPPGPTTSPAPTTSTSPGPTPTTRPPDGSDCTVFPCLILEDNFDFLDYNIWNHEITAGGGGNWEFQYYTNNRSNSYVRDGVLYIKPTLTDDKFEDGFVSSGNLEIWGNTVATECTGNQWWGCQRQGTVDNLANPIQSARLRTVHGFNLRYGKVEVEAKLPRGDWIWPAIWMLPTWEEYGGWPASGEIDLMESRGNNDLTNGAGDQIGNTHFGATMHWAPYMALNQYERTMTDQSGDFADAFHKYGVEWNANEIIFYLDDVEILRVDPGVGGFWGFGEFENVMDPVNNPWVAGDKMAPFDRPFYIIMNVAVGGTNGFFPDPSTNAGYPKPWDNLSPTAPRDFWNAKNSWYPTWNPDVNNGEGAAMQINYVRVYKMAESDVGSQIKAKTYAAGEATKVKPRKYTEKA